MSLMLDNLAEASKGSRRLVPNVPEDEFEAVLNSRVLPTIPMLAEPGLRGVTLRILRVAIRVSTY
jgi:hypothetical protein